MVAEAELGEATASWLPLVESQEEKANGPLSDTFTVAVDPESYQPSPVWLGDAVRE